MAVARAASTLRLNGSVFDAIVVGGEFVRLVPGSVTLPCPSLTLTLSERSALNSGSISTFL